MDVEATVLNWNAFLVCMPVNGLLFHKHEGEEERQTTDDVVVTLLSKGLSIVLILISMDLA